MDEFLKRIIDMRNDVGQSDAENHNKINEDEEVVEYIDEIEDSTYIIDDYLMFIVGEAESVDDIRDALVQLYSLAYSNGVKQVLIEEVEAKINLLNAFKKMTE